MALSYSSPPEAAITEWKRFAYSCQLSYGRPINRIVRIAGTGLATFLFPLPRLAFVFGLVFCALDVAKHWQPAGVALPAEKA